MNLLLKKLVCSISITILKRHHTILVISAYSIEIINYCSDWQRSQALWNTSEVILENPCVCCLLVWCNEKLLFSKIRTLKDLMVLSVSVNCLSSGEKQFGRKSFTLKMLLCNYAFYCEVLKCNIANFQVPSFIMPWCLCAWCTISAWFIFGIPDVLFFFFQNMKLRGENVYFLLINSAINYWNKCGEKAPNKTGIKAKTKKPAPIYLMIGYRLEVKERKQKAPIQICFNITSSVIFTLKGKFWNRILA